MSPGFVTHRGKENGNKKMDVKKRNANEWLGPVLANVGKCTGQVCMYCGTGKDGKLDREYMG